MLRSFSWSFCPKKREHRMALLIDGENIAASDAVYVLAEAGKWGTVLLSRVYGDWSAAQMQPWQEVVTHYGMRAVHQHGARKNAADIALAIEAVELFHQGIRSFCLVSGDSDYRPLVLWLVEHGCQVVVIGHPDTPRALQRACSIFVSTNQIRPPILPKKRLPQAQMVMSPPSTSDRDSVSKDSESAAEHLRRPSISIKTPLQALLVKAYTQVVTEKGEIWVTTTDLGAELQQLDRTFKTKAHGSSSLKGLLQRQGFLFEVQETEGGQAVVRLKASDQEATEEERRKDG
jgi:uncharacterized protein (TIGR00288 family)